MHISSESEHIFLSVFSRKIFCFSTDSANLEGALAFRFGVPSCILARKRTEERFGGPPIAQNSRPTLSPL